jgi:hypothetical protein
MNFVGKLRNLAKGTGSNQIEMVPLSAVSLSHLVPPAIGVLNRWSDDHPTSGVKSYAVDPKSAERLWSVSEGLLERSG